MSSKAIGIEQARKILGDLGLEVQRTGRPITLTRGNSRTPIARIAPLEDTMAEYFTPTGTPNTIRIAEYVTRALEASDGTEGYDIDAITEDIGTTYGYGADLDAIDPAEFWAIVARHAHE